MIVSTAAVPVPLPRPAGGSPATWAGRPLVDATISYRAQSLSGTYVGVELNKPGESGTLPPTTVTDASAFSKINATTLRDAVEAASQVSAKNVLREGFFQATAVMQAGDGTYYLSALMAQVDGSSIYLPLDGSPHLSVQDVTALNPDLRAVVGASSWVNFSGTDLSPTLAGE